VAAWLLTRTTRPSAWRCLDGDYSVFVAKEDSSQPVRLVTSIGSRTPAFASAIGRVHLAAGRPTTVAAAVRRPSARDARRPAPERPRGAGEILATVRDRGYAENDEETAAGLWARPSRS
jgi:IclR family pca regulon transcriptional regulator